MAETVNYKCPSCNGPLKWDGAAQQLTCEYCGSTFTPAQIEEIYGAQQASSDQKAAVEGAKQARDEMGEKLDQTAQQQTEAAIHAGAVQTQAEMKQDPIQAFLNRAPWDEADDGIQSFICNSCGAGLVTDGTTAVQECPYCGNQAVVPGTLSGMLKPDFVIPFEKTKEDAIAALKEHYGNKKFIPDAFLQDNHLEHVQGVYVPFWLYSSSVAFNAHYECTDVDVAIMGKKQITTTSFYDVYREGTVEFQRIPADGSSKMPDAHMDAIEPFDYSKMQPFSVGYLPGYLTERYDMAATDCADRVNRRIDGTVPGLVERTITGAYTGIESLGCDTHGSFTNISYALLPVWMLHTTWNGQNYLFAMNGQTGRMIGDLPLDKGKQRSFFLKRWLFSAIPSIAIIAGVLYFLMS